MDGLRHPELNEYDGLARNLLLGKGFAYPHIGVLYHSYAPPLYSWMSAASYWLTGSIAPLMALQLRHRRRCWRSCLRPSPSVCLVAGLRLPQRVLLVALHPGLIVYNATKAHPLTFDAFFFSLALWQTFRSDGSSDDRASDRVWRDHRRWHPVSRHHRHLSTARGDPAADHAQGFLARGRSRGHRGWPVRRRDRRAVDDPQFAASSSVRLSVYDGQRRLLARQQRARDGPLRMSTLNISCSKRCRLPSERTSSGNRTKSSKPAGFQPTLRAFIQENPAAFVRLTLLKFFHFWWFAPQTGVLYPRTWFFVYAVYYIGALLFAALGIWSVVRIGSSAIALASLIAIFMLALSDASKPVLRRRSPSLGD